MMGKATEIAEQADILIVIGTSMAVYPAAGLISYVKQEVPKYYIDPKAFHVSGISNLKIISEKAGNGVPSLVNELLKND